MILQHDKDHATSLMRELEMAVDEVTFEAGVKIQFFDDLLLYGIDEAVKYHRGYVKDNEKVDRILIPVVNRVKSVIERDRLAETDR